MKKTARDIELDLYHELDIFNKSSSNPIELPKMSRFGYDSIEIPLRDIVKVSNKKLSDIFISDKYKTIPLSYINIDKLIYMYLKRDGIATFGDLENRTEAEMQDIPNIGPERFKRICVFMRKFGLTFKPSLEEQQLLKFVKAEYIDFIKENTEPKSGNDILVLPTNTIFTCSTIDQFIYHISYALMYHYESADREILHRYIESSPIIKEVLKDYIINEPIEAIVVQGSGHLFGEGLTSPDTTLKYDIAKDTMVITRKYSSKPSSMIHRYIRATLKEGNYANYGVNIVCTSDSYIKTTDDTAVILIDPVIKEIIPFNNKK